MSGVNEIKERLAEATSASKLALEIEEALAKELREAIKAAASHLLPCPFCGGKAEFSYSRHDDGDRAPRDWRHVRVQCGSCEAAQEWTRYGSMEPRKEEPEAEAAAELDAATAWNCRTSAAEQFNSELLAQLKHAVHWHDQLTPSDIARYEAAIAKAEGISIASQTPSKGEE